MKANLELVKNWAKVQYGTDYKTAILGSESHLHLIVTRVNRITAKLWLDNIYSKLMGSSGFPDVPKDKPNWLIMNRSFRREKDKEIKSLN